MTGYLPEGLVTTTKTAPADLDGLDGVDIEDLVHLWRVYTTNPSVLEGDVGHRLENFFWRILSSKRISTSIRGSTLAQLFAHISKATSLSDIALRHNGQSSNTPRPSQSSFKNKNCNGREPDQSALGTGRSPLPPILKKSTATQGELPKTTRLLLTGPSGQSFTRKPSNPPTPNPPALPLMGDMTGRKGQKKSYFVANTAANSKRRPVIMRRKSSQTSPTTGSASDLQLTTSQSASKFAAKKPQPRELDMPQLKSAGDFHLPSEESNSDESEQHLSPWLSGGNALLSTAASPRSKKSSPLASGFATGSTHHHGSAKDLSPEQLQQQSYQPSSQSLVDKDFRTRFVEKRLHAQRSAASSLKSSSSRDKQSHRPSESNEPDGIPESPQGTTMSVPAADTSHITKPSIQIHATPTAADEAPTRLSLETPSVHLPRPRSQLSLLIEENRDKRPTSCSHESGNWSGNGAEAHRQATRNPTGQG